LPIPTPETAPDIPMNEMTCQQCEERLQELLDGAALVSGPSLDAHLVHCAGCRGLFAAARHLQVRLCSLPTPIPPTDLGRRIVAGVLSDARRQRRLRVSAMVGVGLAASLLLAWLGSWAFLHHSRPPEIVAASQRDPEPPLPAVVPNEPSLHENVADATSAVASLSRRTADDALGGAQLLVPPMTLPTPDDLTPPLDPPAQALIDTGHGASVSLQPVTNSAKRAFGLFVRDLPPLNPPEKPGL
jgi:hypothetical protein